MLGLSENTLYIIAGIIVLVDLSVIVYYGHLKK